MRRPKRLFRNRPPHPAVSVAGVIELSDHGRPVPFPLLTLPTSQKDRVARAVHRAADRYYSRLLHLVEDGGKCVYYTFAGAVILTHLGYQTTPNFGSMVLAPDRDDPSRRICWDADGDEPDNFHGCLISSDRVMIDFSARDWPQWVEQHNKKRRIALASGELTPQEVQHELRWNRPPMDYFWCPIAEIGEHLVGFKPSWEVTKQKMQYFHKRLGPDFSEMAIATYLETT
jgi:hypothetical protein